MTYLFFDGDNVGNTIEKYLLTDKMESAQKISNGINIAIEKIRFFLEKNKNVKILLVGGDDVLITLDINDINKDSIELEVILYIQKTFQEETGLTISCGIGSTVTEAIFNLHKAKVFGKNQIVK